MNRLCILVLALCFQRPDSAIASDRGQLEDMGRAVLQEKCAACHALDLKDESPLKAAPPMRDVYERFAPEELKAELSEGLVSRHRAMPQVAFSAEQVDAILAYLHRLAQRK